MKNLKLNLLALAAIVSVTFTSCGDDDSAPVIPPIAEGNVVTVSNFYTGPLGPEASADSVEFALLLEMSSGALDVSGTVSNDDVEIVNMLEVSAAGINGLYDIDFTENSITFNETGSLDTENYWADSYRTIEAGTIDEYVITFSDAHNITSGTHSVTGLTFDVIDDNVVTVEISEGFVLSAGVTFTISLD